MFIFCFSASTLLRFPSKTCDNEKPKMGQKEVYMGGCLVGHLRQKVHRTKVTTSPW